MKPEKQLYQWDTNQSFVELTPSAQYVDYPMGNEVIRIDTDGTRCRIPDEFLQTAGFKTCYERYSDGTYKAYSFNVLSSPKPPDYVYTPEERTTFETLTARVDAAIEDIKRRADSGEFTPVKGVDYFTDAEKAEMMESVSTGAIGEFRNVVDTATTEYNDNASEKLTTYDTNAEQHTTDYNRNAAEKLTEYNDNATEKLNAYNANADNRVAEFNSQTEQIQTDISELKSDLSNKLPKSPTEWEEWTAEEQAMARLRIGADGGTMEFIADITTTEDADVISIDKFPDGTPLKLKSFDLYFIIPKASTDEYVNSGHKFKYNNETGTSNRDSANKLISSKYDTYNNMYVMWNNARPIGFVSNPATWVNGSIPISSMFKYDNTLEFTADYICEVHLVKYISGIQIPSGTRMVLWGVRA